MAETDTAGWRPYPAERPEPGHVVLVTDGEAMFLFIYAPEDRATFPWECPICTGYDLEYLHDLSGITHWRPLPPLPSEDLHG